jgi:hypothetical protein
MRSTLRIRIITWLATRDCADAVVVLSAHVRTNGHVQGATTYFNDRIYFTSALI